MERMMDHGWCSGMGWSSRCWPQKSQQTARQLREMRFRSFCDWPSDRTMEGVFGSQHQLFNKLCSRLSPNHRDSCYGMGRAMFFLFPAMWWRWSFHRKTSCGGVREHDPMRKMQSVAGVTMVTLDPTLNHIPNPETFPRRMDWLKNGIDPQLSGWWFGTWIIFVHFIYGMSSFHWRTHIFQRGRYTTNQ